MYRVTKKRLQSQVDYLNKLVGAAQEPYRQSDGKFCANVGTYLINYDYNQPQLQKLENESGGVSDPFGYRGTKAEIDRMLSAFIRGIEEGKRLSA